MDREIQFYKKHFIEFYVKQSPKVQQKIDYVLMLVKSVDIIPDRFLKHVSGTTGLYEIRIKQGYDIFRIFCSFDEGQKIIIFNAFQKKTRKTPKKEIQKGLKLMKEYFETKEGKLK